MIFTILFLALFSNVLAETSEKKVNSLGQTQPFALEGTRFTDKKYLGAIGANDGGFVYQTRIKFLLFSYENKFDEEGPIPYKFSFGTFYDIKEETRKAHKRVSLFYVQQRKYFGEEHADWKRSVILTNTFEIATANFGNSVGFHTYDTKLESSVDLSLGFTLNKELIKFWKLSYGAGIEYRLYLGPRLKNKSSVGTPGSSENLEILEQNNRQTFFNQFLQRNRFKLSFKYCDLIYEMNFHWKDFNDSANEIVGFDHNQSSFTLALKKWWD